MIIFFDGKFVDDSQAFVSVYDGAFLMGHGVYEAMRTYNGVLLDDQMDFHMDRFFQSAEAMGLPVPYTREEIVRLTHELVEKRFEEIGEVKDLRIRHTLTSGHDSVRNGEVKDSLFLMLAPEISVEQMDPVKLVTFEIERIRPHIKTTAMIANILAKQYAVSNGAYESILINRHRRPTEGTFTNIWLVKDGVLITPEKDILYGVTRKEILSIAGEIMPVEVRDVEKTELYTADEMFISNSPLGLIPVTHVDDHAFSHENPYTQKIMNAYKKKVCGIS